MFSCEKCCKEFRTNWQLQRHYSKKIPCNVEFPRTANDSLKSCMYCGVHFARAYNLKVHMKTCKAKDDVVRCLEIQLGIDLPQDATKKQCRFCDYTSGRVSNVHRHAQYETLWENRYPMVCKLPCAPTLLRTHHPNLTDFLVPELLHLLQGE